MSNTVSRPGFLKALGVTVLFAACTPVEVPVNDATVAVADTGRVVAKVLYQMPTPNELFHVVRTMSGEGQKRMMNPAGNLVHYNTTPKRALNFGVYATDLAYASSFKLSSEVARYFMTCKTLGGDLGLATSFNGGDLARLERNLANGDSLDVISDEAYLASYRRLQENEMGPVLSLVLAGGWVESMHLVAHDMPHFDPEDPLIMTLAEQKASLNHLIDLMGAYPTDPVVLNIQSRLLAIRDIYDTFPVVRSAHVGASPSGRPILGDDVKVVMSAEGYLLLKNALEALREDIVRPEDMKALPNA